MLNTGIKKELMFFTRSFRVWGIIIAAVMFAVVSPLLMKLSYIMLDYMADSMGDSEGGNTTTNNMSYYSENYENKNMTSVDPGMLGELDSMTDPAMMSSLGFVSSLGDLTSTLMLITMLVTMYSAGGELKKRSMIIPQNAGLTPKLYILPKYLVYPAIMAVIGFCGIWISYGVCHLIFAECEITIKAAAITALCAGVFDAFMTAVYFTLGLCTSKAGLAVVIMYGGNVILTTLFSALGADKFHPFTLTTQAQYAVMGNEVDALNLWGSIGITLLIVVLCYFVTLFVISAKKIDNRGKEEMQL